MIKESGLLDDIDTTLEWLVVLVQIEVLKAANEDTVYKIVDDDFRVISSEGRVYEDSLLSTVEASLYPGATHEGWLIFQVKPTDAPLLRFDGYSWNSGDSNSDILWWKLYTVEAVPTAIQTPKPTATPTLPTKTPIPTTAPFRVPASHEGNRCQQEHNSEECEDKT